MPYGLFYMWNPKCKQTNRAQIQRTDWWVPEVGLQGGKNELRACLSREVPAHGFGLLGSVRRRGNVIALLFSLSTSLQAINSRLIVFKAVILWLSNNNDNDDSNEVEPPHRLDIMPSGQMSKLRTLCPGTWAPGWYPWAMRIWPLCSRRFSFSVGKRLLGSGSQGNELGAELCYFSCFCYFC